MKKISILLSLILSAFIISSCAENNPNNPNDSNNSNNSTKITLSQRAGNYEGDMSGTTLTMVFDNQGQVTKIMVGELDFNTIGILPAKVGEPTSTNTEYIFDVEMRSGSTTKVKVIFDSDTQATGGKAYIDLTGAGFLTEPIIIQKIS